VPEVKLGLMEEPVDRFSAARASSNIRIAPGWRINNHDESLKCVMADLIYRGGGGVVGSGETTSVPVWFSTAASRDFP
jgi:hypothetical protein